MTQSRALSVGSDSPKSRADVLSDLLDFAFGELLWISEAPNRSDIDGTSLELAQRARDACARVEREDPDKEWTGP